MNNIRVNFNILKFIECNEEKEDLFGVDIEYKDDINTIFISDDIIQ